VPAVLNRLTVPLLSLVAALAVAAPAGANGVQVSMMMDDDLLVYRSAKTTDKTLDQMAKLGVDYVRVTVLWKVVADKARNTRKKDRHFRKLGADNPKAYPVRNWDRFDHLVNAASARGIGVYFNVTGPGPAGWCCEKPPKGEEVNRETWMPKAREFKNFVKAVGTRYSGKYRDENVRGRPKLPRVAFWSLWNEPNQGGWLTPQIWKGKPYSPMLFRDLYVKGREGLVATGHGDDVILLGETAPIGKDENRSRAPMTPLKFITELFCVDSSGARKSGGLGCDSFTRNGPLQATAFAHHPYSKTRSPLQKDSNPRAITMANLDTLTRLLDNIAEKTGRIQKDALIALTENGYETKPPDPYNGISLKNQADWNVLGELLAWANPRVISQTQFLLRDVKPLSSEPKTSERRWFTYQSGLYYNNGRPKPSAGAYAFPFITQPGAGGTIVWGQLRWRPNRAQDQVIVQYKATGAGDWTNLGSPIATAQRNFFTGVVTPPGPGQLRAVWLGPEGVAVSRTQDVG
jgi:hypothetical protein